MLLTLTLASMALNAKEAGAASVTAKEAVADTVMARSVFADLPVSTLDLLSKNTRLDMLDYWDVDSVYRATNNLKGRSYIRELTPDFIEVQLTEVSTLQIKVLPQRGSNPLIMTVYTVGEEGQPMESDVEFYDSALNPLPKEKFLKAPELKDFTRIPKGSKMTLKEVEQLLPFFTVAYKTEASGDGLTATLELGDILTIENSGKVMPLLSPKLSYRWNGKKFQMIKQP